MRSSFFFLLLSFGILLASLSSLTAQDLPSPSSIRETLSQWVKTKQLIGAEAANWAEEKETLERINALRSRELEALQEEIATNKEKAAEFRQQEKTIEQASKELRQWSTQSSSQLKVAETSVARIIPSLPAPLQEELETVIEDFREIEQDPTARTSVERLRSTLAIITACESFDSKISRFQEVLPINGEPTRVTTVYLGLSQAYYLDPTGNYSGQATRSSEGFTWQENNQISKQVSQLVAILERKSEPDFISLPIKP